MPGDLLAEGVELVLREPPLEVRPRVVARRGVALEVDEVRSVVVLGAVPEVVEADLVKRGHRLVARDVPAELRGGLVGADHHRDGVPADDRSQPPLDRGIPGSLASRSGAIVFT